MARLAAQPSQITHVPLLAQMLELYALPRDPGLRFPRYLAIIGAGETVAFPSLIAMNPMAREHVAAYLAGFLAAGYEAQTQDWVDAAARSVRLTGAYRHGYGVADDLGGGWTHGADVEMKRRFVVPPAATAPWMCTTLRVSQPATPAGVAHEVSASIVRRAWQQHHGQARTLRQHLAQEQTVARVTPPPTQPARDIDTIAALLEPHLDTTAYPTIVAALLGDAAAVELGYAPLGVGDYAGLAYAMHPAAPDFSDQ